MSDFEEKELNLTKIMFYYLSYWKWLLMSIVFSLFVGFVYLCKKNDVYEVKTSVLIKDEEKGLSELAMLQELGFSSGQNIVDNEIQVFKSPDLIKNAIEEVDYHISYQVDGFFDKERIHNSESPIKLRMFSDLSTPNFVVNVLPQGKNSTSYKVQVEYKGKKYSQQIDSLPATIKMNEKLMFVLESQFLDTIRVPLYIYVSDLEMMALRISSMLKVDPATKNSTVLNIKMTTNHRRCGEDFLTALTYHYNRQAEQDKNQIAYNTAVFIEERVKALSVELSSVEKDVEAFKMAHKITDISSEADLFLGQTGENERKLKETETQLSIIEYVETFINEEENKDKLIPNLGITDHGLSQLINRYNESLLEKERLQDATTMTNPIYERLVTNLSNMRSGIQNSVVSVRNTLEITMANLSLAEEKTTAKIQQIPKIEREFLEIKRQQQIKETLYLFLLQKREETSLTLAATAPKAKIISQSRASLAPISPKKPLVLLIAFAIGLFLPIVYIYLRDTIRSTIQDRDYIDQNAKPAVIGEITQDDSMDTLLVRSDNKSSTVELFRSLRNSIIQRFNSTDKKVIAITSSISNEGKTFIASNLAQAFSLINKKVLLVGLDIRNPMLAHLYGIEQKDGISDYLAGEVSRVDDLICYLPEFEGLDLLPCGHIPPNPNELLSKKELDDLFANLRKQYDYIIIDTAPIGLVSDTSLVNRVVDMTLYVAREGSTTKDCIDFVNVLYDEQKLNDIQIVINGVNMGRRGYYYRRSYYYGYYYYSQKSKRKKSIINRLFS
jgi:capsular exopolysaccharide synthesis family protein